MKQKKIISKLLAIVLSLSVVSGMAFALPWDLAQGSITVDTSSGTQMVSQVNGLQNQADSAPVISQSNSDTATDNTITITGKGTANVTIQDVNMNIGPSATSSAIDVQGTTTANIQAQGENKITSITPNGYAGIHVSEGNLNLNITEDSSLTVNSVNSWGAAIGSHSSYPLGAPDDMSGTIRISGPGSTEIKGVVGQGAGIGSGADGKMSGSIILGEGTVKVDINGAGAGIGSGTGGKMSGSITTGEGSVTAESSSGAGIGSGESIFGEECVGMTGRITLGSGSVTAKSGSGAGIGAGEYDEMTGTVSGGSGSITAESESGAGIGSGNSSRFSGDINLTKGGNVHVQSVSGDPMGRGENGSLKDDRLTIVRGTVINGKEIQTAEDLEELGIAITTINLIDPPEPVSAAPASSSQTLYWILKDGNPIACESVQENGVLVVTAKAENGELHFTGYGLRELAAQGVKTVVFRTDSLESSFEIGDVSGCSNLVLTHEGTKAALTLDGEASDLLK